MVDKEFADAELAELYDVFHPPGERADYAFYLGLMRAAPEAAVLDVACGTGTLLAAARAQGHAGRLCGIDPAPGMIGVARTHPGVEWVHGDLTSVRWDGEFDLAVMAGHAFQVFVTDDELRIALTAIRTALVDGGRFAFETRNPSARAWEGWVPEHAFEVTDGSGATVRVEHRVRTPVVGDRVSFTATYSSTAWDRPRVSHSTLRFLDRRALAAALAGAGLTVTEQFGDWDGGPLTDTGPEIITIARRA
jgi:SAM-dependent methyltransferase